MDHLLQRVPELILRIAELSEVDDIRSLLQIPVFAKYIIEYKRSIIKEKQKGFLLPAGWAGTEAVIRHSPKGPIEACPDFNRYVSNTTVAFLDDWESVTIMEERDAEISSLVNTSSYLRLCPGPGAKMSSWPKLEDDAVDNLRVMFRRALYICDAIYDMEAQSLIDIELPVPAYCFTPRIPQPLTFDQAMDWYYFLECSHANTLQRALCLCRIPDLARTRQFKFIQKLSDEDLLALWTLCYFASESFHEWRSTAFLGDIENITGKERAFKHCILSFGSYFLYAHVRGNGARCRHKTSLLNPVINEFTTEDPEEANRLGPGVLAALNNTLMNRLGVKINDVDDRALGLLVGKLGVKREAFDEPPSTTVWGGTV